MMLGLVYVKVRGFMQISENLKFNNIIRCTLLDAQTSEIIQICEQPNTVVNTGKQLVLDIMGGVNTQIKHGAVGNCLSGTTSAGTVLLISEIARTPCVYTRAGQIGTFSVFFNTSQASGIIKEVGFFGGTSSFTSTNTGIMFNRILLASGINKNNNYTLTVDLDVTF